MSETVSETASEAVSETVSEAVSETASDRMRQCVRHFDLDLDLDLDLARAVGWAAQTSGGNDHAVAEAAVKLLPDNGFVSHHVPEVPQYDCVCVK
eukprot:361420-Rhodomonas_salina.2